MRKKLLKLKIRFYKNRLRKYNGQYLYHGDVSKVGNVKKALYWKRKLEAAKTEWFARNYAELKFGEDVTFSDFNPKQHAELLDDPAGTEPQVVEIEAEDWDDPVPNKTVPGEEVLIIPDPPDLALQDKV